MQNAQTKPNSPAAPDTAGTDPGFKLPGQAANTPQEGMPKTTPDEISQAGVSLAAKQAPAATIATALKASALRRSTVSIITEATRVPSNGPNIASAT